MRRGPVVLLVAFALQLVVGASLLQLGGADRPHRAPVMVVGPEVVAPVIVERADGFAGRPFDAVASTSVEAGRRSLADGSVVAVVVIDLAADRDTALLASTNGGELDSALLREARAVEATFGRELEVEQVTVSSLDRRVPFVVVAGCLVLGFAASLVSCWIRGPADLAVRDLGIRLRRHIGFAALVGLVGLASVWFAGGDALSVRSVAGWLALGGLLTVSSSVTSSALMSLMGVGGLVVASTLFAVLAAPLAQFRHPLVLDEPWATLTPWLPHGAGLDLAQALAAGGAGSVRSWLVLGTYLVVPLVVLVAAQRERTSPGAPASERESPERRRGRSLADG